MDPSTAFYGTLNIGERIAEDFLAGFRQLVPEAGNSLDVLDLFCGKGFFLRGLQQRMPSWNLYGFDQNPPIIEEARNNCPEAIIETHRFPPMPYPTSSFDLITANMVMDYSDTRPSVGFPTSFDFVNYAHELSRGLRKGGHFSPFIDVPVTDLESEILRDFGLVAQPGNFPLFRKIK
jgi:SAM-dependent methyltransferase